MATVEQKLVIKNKNKCNMPTYRIVHLTAISASRTGVRREFTYTHMYAYTFDSISSRRSPILFNLAKDFQGCQLIMVCPLANTASS